MSKLLANQIANYGDDAPIEIKEGLNIPAGKPIQAAGSAGSPGQVLSTTGTTIEWVAAFDGNYNSLSNKPSIPAAQVPADWDASGGVARILNKPAVPPLPSVTTLAASGGGSLLYNGVNGEFTFTPASISPNWDTAYGWGDHGAAGYLTAEADTLADVTGRGATTNDSITLGDASNQPEINLSVGASSGNVNYLKIFGGSNEVYFRNTTGSGGGGSINIQGRTGVALWQDTGNLGLQVDSNCAVKLYYQTSQKLETTAGGVEISGDIALGSGNLTTTGKLLYANHYDNLGDLPGASTYHGMFAHVHNEGHGYFAHAGAWVQLVDTTSSIDELGDVDLSSAPSDGYVLKWEQSSSSWKAQPDLVGSGGSGIVLSDLSVSTQSASGGGSLSYGNTTGVFTYTPPDLSGFLSAETDPVFSASPAAGILSSNISNWDAAYGWGNHATAGYLTSLSIDLADLTDVTINQANISNGDVLAWNQSNSRWENSTPTGGGGSGSDDLDDVTSRGATTTNDIQVNKVHADTILAAGPTFGTGATGTYVSIAWDGGGTYKDMKLQTTTGGGTVTFMTLQGDTSAITAGGSFTAGSLTASGTSPKLRINNSSNTGYAEFDYRLVGNAAYQLPALPSTSGDVLSCTTAGVMSWVTPGGGGANVTISDTIPAGTPTAGDLWWESDTGRLKVYYVDTDSPQWVDASPPLTQDRIASSSAPSSATDTGVPGDIRYDSGYVYICISNNTWKRAALTTW